MAIMIENYYINFTRNNANDNDIIRQNGNEKTV